MSLYFLMQGYGGCFNPPCRQRPNVLKRLISRASMIRQSAMEFARPVDKFLKVFGFYEAIQRRIAVRVSATDTTLNCLQTTKLQILAFSCKGRLFKIAESVRCVVTPTLLIPWYKHAHWLISLQPLPLLTYRGFL